MATCSHCVHDADQGRDHVLGLLFGDGHVCVATTDVYAQPDLLVGLIHKDVLLRLCSGDASLKVCDCCQFIHLLFFRLENKFLDT